MNPYVLAILLFIIMVMGFIIWDLRKDNAKLLKDNEKRRLP
jgi:uncharacterized Tic20 family protein